MAGCSSGCRNPQPDSPPNINKTRGTINTVDYKKFALVIPTLNEVENIVPVLDRAREALSKLPLPWEILVVDDDSKDATQALVRRYSETRSGIRLVERHAQKGLAGAITYGWEHTDADILGVMDADLQHPPELLPELVNRVCQGLDIAIASRYLNADSMKGWSLPRRLISRLSILASKPVQRSGLRVRDPMSGFFVLRRDCIEGIQFQSEGFKLLLEILAKGHIRSVAEIPFRFGTRVGGQSKANGMTAVHYFSLLCTLSRDLICGRENHLRQEASDSGAMVKTQEVVNEPPSSETDRRSHHHTDDSRQSD
jgi:dolichol-phosphate mannosyltransferase